jgi:hypothetical protein
MYWGSGVTCNAYRRSVDSILKHGSHMCCVQQINGYEPRVQHTADQWTWATCTAYSRSMGMSHVCSIQQINGHEPRVQHTANQWTWATCTAHRRPMDMSQVYCIQQINGHEPRVLHTTAQKTEYWDKGATCAVWNRSVKKRTAALESHVLRRKDH